MNDLIILSILLSGPMHGYGLKRAAGLILGQESMHSNLVYPLLRRFVSEGWVKQRSAPGERGQTRKLYTLTDLGRHTLIERLGKYSEQEARSPEAFLVRVGLFGVLSREVRERILNTREHVLRARDERLAKLQRGMELGVYGGDIIRHLRQEIVAEVNWIRHLHRLQRTQKGKSS
jgi:DNA-binding PadR family transcriptional regulator